MFNIGDKVRVRTVEEIQAENGIAFGSTLTLRYYQNCYAEITHICDNNRYRIKPCDKDFESNIPTIREFVDEITRYIWPEICLELMVPLEYIPQPVTEDEFNAIIFEQVNK